MEDGNCNIYRLPRDCLHLLFSLTSPRDVCRLSAVSTYFLSAATSDALWERFVPADYESILSRAAVPMDDLSDALWMLFVPDDYESILSRPVDHVDYVDPVDNLSKRELYFRLCNPMLIDRGLMSFALDKSSGAKCYMLSARMLAFDQDAQPWVLEWFSLPSSRFSEVVEIWWAPRLNFQSKIECRMLTPRTTYAAYFIYTVRYRSIIGLGFPYQKTAVKLGAHVSEHTVHLRPDKPEPNTPRVRRFYQDFDRRLGTRVGRPRGPREREDGWMEMEMGEFYNDEGEDGELEMNMTQIWDDCNEEGLVIQGIEIRPKQ